jgi:predicted RNA-binding protein associated with RNAse of E/G family
MEKTSPEILVRKLNPAGDETYRYWGRELRRGEQFIQLEALFTLEQADVYGILLQRNDRFIETYYTDRWYNTYEIRDREDGRLKGWYCNISCPAEIQDHEVTWRDLALDLLVYPDGQQRVLDEDEFADLNLDEETRQQALTALADLQHRFKTGDTPG